MLRSIAEHQLYTSFTSKDLITAAYYFSITAQKDSPEGPHCSLFISSIYVSLPSSANHAGVKQQSSWTCKLFTSMSISQEISLNIPSGNDVPKT